MNSDHMNGRKVVNQGDNSDDTIELFGMLRRRRLLLVSTFLVGIGAASAYQFLAERLYEARLELMVMRRDSSVPATGVDGQSEVDGTTLSGELLANHMKLLSSRRIIKDAIETFQLDQLKSVADAEDEGISPVDYIAEQLAVDAGGEGMARDASVLIATLRDPSKTDCATILNAVLACYQKHVKNSFAGESDAAIEVNERTRERLAQELVAAQSAYQQFRETTKLIWENDQARNVHQERLKALEDDLREVQKKISETGARAQVIREVLASKQLSEVSDLDRLALLSDRETQRLKLLFDVSKGDPNNEEFQADQPLRSATAKAQYEELLSLMLKERSLLSDFGSDHPSVQITREKIEVIKQFLAENAPKEVENEIRPTLDPKEMLVTYERLLGNDLLQDKKLQESILQEIARESELARALAADELRGQALLDDIATKKQLQREAIASLGGMARARDFGGFKVDVLAAAEPQKDAAWPDGKIVLALGGVGGLILGFMLALLADVTDSTFRNPDDVENVLGLSVLSHVPVLPPQQKRDPELANIVPEICVAHRPKSKEAEVFRSLRTSLFFTAASSKLQVLQITSPNTGDGKSTVSANIACAIARSGKSVLLVDCDLRRPRVASIFGVPRETGLSSVLAGQAEIPDVIQNSGLEHLSILPAGPIPPNPAELLTSATFGECLDVLREKFDFVILDTPPMLAVSDPGIIASHADGVLLTLRILKNGRGASIRAKELLEELNANLMGVIVNCSQRFAKHYGYSDYRYDESYSYQYRDNKYYEQEKKTIGYSRSKSKSEA
ncbi:MAG: polysaccharide biosynthesis tyrosine autokinase [Planctomycetaceae bacterium]